jgi:hypothetical protein
MNNKYFSYYEKPADFKLNESKLSNGQTKEEDKDQYRLNIYERQSQYNCVVDEEESSQVWYFQYLTDEKCKNILENETSLSDGAFLINKEHDLPILYILYFLFTILLFNVVYFFKFRKK